MEISVNHSKPTFLWGAATSSHQIEGYNDKNDWWAWESLGKIERGERSGPCTDHWNRFRDDLKLAADLGLNSYRFSVEWSRLEPQEGKWDSEAFDWYRELILECERLGLVPMLTLQHFTLPLWMAEQGGFSWERSPELFARFTRQVVERLGSKVALWCTINEPMVMTAGSYLGQFMPPALYSPEKARMACYHLLKSHVLAYDLIHREIPKSDSSFKDIPVQVGIAHNVIDFVADRSRSVIERWLAEQFHQFYNLAWLDAITGREQQFSFPLLMAPAPTVPEAMGRLTVDYLGINYYTRARVQFTPKWNGLPINVAFARDGERASDVDWPIHPQGLQKMLKIAGGYQLPIYITENGIADKSDHLRTDYIRDHVRELALASQNGVDVRGYYHWSLLDNFEWVKGFEPRFGLYQVDYSTFERKATQSAYFYQEVIERHLSLGGRPQDLGDLIAFLEEAPNKISIPA
jgi:beta-glucosidase